MRRRADVTAPPPGARHSDVSELAASGVERVWRCTRKRVRIALGYVAQCFSQSPELGFVGRLISIVDITINITFGLEPKCHGT